MSEAIEKFRRRLAPLRGIPVDPLTPITMTYQEACDLQDAVDAVVDEQQGRVAALRGELGRVRAGLSK